MTMQQVTMSEYLKTRYGSFPHCGSCVCQKCLYWWSGRCPEGECYDDKRAKEEPYNKAFPERSPRTQWSNWNLPGEQARIGNSVVPIMAQKLVEANCPYLKVGERVPNLNIDDSQGQLRFA